MTESTRRIEPLKLNSRLAGTPAPLQHHKTTVSLSNGKSLEVADPKAVRALVALMDMQAVMGGAASHWGGPSAFAELMAATHALMFEEARTEGKPWHEKFNFVNDAGHCENGLYALKALYGFADLTIDKLKGFRSIQSPLTGHGEAHLFAEGVLVSNGPLGSGLPQAQGLAFADALAGRERVTVAAISDGGCMEGEAKEALAAIPGLCKAGEMAPFVMIISDNNTKLSGRIDDQTFSMNPTFASLADLGWKVIAVSDGHDLEKVTVAMAEAIELAKANPLQPVVVHAKTIKGYGVKATEESASGGHGFPVKAPTELGAFIEEIYSGEAVPAEFTSWLQEMLEQHAAKPKGGGDQALPIEKVQVGVAKALKKKREEGLPVFSISSDLPGSTGTQDFQKAFPECAKDIGVAEANMISMATGLSLGGYIPVVDTFSQFGVTKGALPLLMAALSQGPMIAIFSHAGFQDAADGASHQALSYLSMTNAIPHTDSYCLTCSEEAEALVGQAVDEFYHARMSGKVPRSKIFFLGRETFPRRFAKEEIQYQLGKAQVIKDTTEGKSQSVTLAASGPLLYQALLAANALKKENIGTIVVNPSICNQPDVETFAECLKKTNGFLVTVEDHQLQGGMGSVLVHNLVQAEVPLKAKSLGVDDQFGQSAYQAIELYKKHGLDSTQIAKTAQALL